MSFPTSSGCSNGCTVGRRGAGGRSGTGDGGVGRIARFAGKFGEGFVRVPGREETWECIPVISLGLRGAGDAMDSS